MNKVGRARSGAARTVVADGSPASLLRLRAAITVFFALDGFVFAGWVVRIPAIKEQTHASSSALGLALLGVSAGAIVTMALVGRACRHYGNHPVTVWCAVLVSLAIALPPHMHTAWSLGAVLLVFGIGYGGINVAMNSAAVDLVNALGRPVMPSFHAAFSLGGMLGAGLGGLVASRLSPSWHLALLTVIGLLVTAAATPALLRHRAPGTPAPSRVTRLAPGAEAAELPGGDPAAKTPARGGITGVVVILGVVALCSSYGEGAMADWGALHLDQDLDASAGAASAGYSLFALAMMIGRLSGTALLERLGPTLTVVGGAFVSSAGMLISALAPTLWLALVGFTVMGLGVANIFPATIGRAGTLAGPQGVATASTLGYGGLLLGPPVIGFMADWFSLPTALLSVSVLAALAGVIAWTTRRAGEPRAPRPAEPA
ncbi:MFS transporter [Streptomyces sp. SPB074]|uniref:MFS transporter n=1 Tax=Streptomyces sp. (strain SPB074) TaxID=465543 RepID=UPI00017FEAF3|nr:MFS transporter [Streptomyces sp. SPB074]EDY44785.1 integral membrane transporter [Streptomyces sp. SPB074]